MRTTLLLLLLEASSARPPLSARLGAIFSATDSSLTSSLALAVDLVTNSSSVLATTRLDQLTSYSSPGQPLETLEVTCRQLEHSVFAVVTATDQEELVGAVLQRAALPHLSLQVASEAESGAVLHLAPSRESVGVACLEVALAVGGRAALVHHPASGVLDPGPLLEGLPGTRLLLLTRADNREELAVLREEGVTSLVVDLAGSLVKAFLYQAMQAGLLSPGTTFIFTSLDFASLDLDFALLSGAQLLGLSLLEPATLETLGPELARLVTEDHRAALLYDAVLLFSSGLASLSNRLDPQSERLKCGQENGSWAQGAEFRQELGAQGGLLEGLTGGLGFQGGWREGQELHLVARGPEGLRQVATFNCDLAERELVVWTGGLETREEGLVVLGPRGLGGQVEGALARQVAILGERLPYSLSLRWGERGNRSVPPPGQAWLVEAGEVPQLANQVLSNRLICLYLDPD